MSDYDLIFLGMIAIIALNQFIIRSQMWQQQIWIYWTVQIINVSFGSWMLMWGIPNLQPPLDIINIFVGLLFFFHAAKNLGAFQKWQQDQKESD